MPDEAVEELKVPIDLEQEKSRPRLVALLFFDYAKLTSDGKLNLFGIFERLFVDREAKKTVPFGVFIRTAETLEGKISVRIISPENKVTGGFGYSLSRKDMLSRQDIKVPHIGEQLMMQMVSRVHFDAPVEGIYWFDVLFGRQSLGGSPLRVEYRDLKELEDGIARGNA